MPQSRIHVVAAPEAVGAPHPTLALGAVCCAVLLVQIDTAIVNLAARPIGAYFVASFEAMQWVIDAYNLVYATLLLSGGLLADFYGRRRLFVIGALAFTFGSAVCAGAPSIGALVAGRVVAGAGAAMLIPASLAIVRVAWPDPAARARVLGAWAVCNGLAIAVGPTSAVCWRSRLAGAASFSSPSRLAWPLAGCAPRLRKSADPHGRNSISRRNSPAGLPCSAFASLRSKRADRGRRRSPPLSQPASLSPPSFSSNGDRASRRSPRLISSGRGRFAARRSEPQV